MRGNKYLLGLKKKTNAILGAQIQGQTQKQPDYRVRARDFYEKRE